MYLLLFRIHIQSNFSSVQISNVQEKGSASRSAPVDSAFSDNAESENQTGNDVTSFVLTGDSGKPVSPEGSTPFVPEDEGSPQGPEGEDSDGELPPWLENVTVSFSFRFEMLLCIPGLEKSTRYDKWIFLQDK